MTYDRINMPRRLLGAYFEVHVGVDGFEVTLVFHAPLELDHHRLAGEIV